VTAPPNSVSPGTKLTDGSMVQGIHPKLYYHRDFILKRMVMKMGLCPHVYCGYIYCLMTQCVAELFNAKIGSNVEGSNVDMWPIILVGYERKIHIICQDSNLSDTDSNLDLTEYEAAVLKTRHCKLFCGKEKVESKGCEFLDAKLKIG